MLIPPFLKTTVLLNYSTSLIDLDPFKQRSFHMTYWLACAMIVL